MLVSVTFADLTVGEARALVDAFQHIKKLSVGEGPEAELTSQAPTVAEPEKLKRKRRTKAQIAADAAEEAEARATAEDKAAGDTGPAPEPVRRRRRVIGEAEPRRRRGGQAAADPTTSPATSTTRSLSDEVSDADLLRAASGAAEVVTPDGVFEVLEALGVGSVNELVGEQRREFVLRCASAVAVAEADARDES